MKKLILVLTLVFLLVAGTAFAATINCIMYSSENDGDPGEAGAPGAGYPITSDYTFTIETDDVTGKVISFTNLFGPFFLSYKYGGWNTEDSAPFDADEQIFEDGITYNLADIIYDGNPVSEPGHGLWYCHNHPIPGLFGNFEFNVGLFGINFDGTSGDVIVGPIEELADHYVFHAVPIPATGWLLMSGLFGLAGFRKKLRKEG